MVLYALVLQHCYMQQHHLNSYASPALVVEWLIKLCSNTAYLRLLCRLCL